MAFNLENMTVDYKKLLNVVPTQRTQLAQSGAIDDLVSALTPGQLTNLFPKYYRDKIPDIGSATGAISGAMTGVGGYRPSGGSSYSPKAPVKLTQKPEQKAIQELFEKAGLSQIGSGVTSGITDRKGRVVSTANTNLSPQERALLDTIAMGDAKSEGNYWESPNYNTIVGGKSFESYEDHPRVFGTASSTAAGRYQFTKTTWDDTVSRYNNEHPNDPITDFSPGNQDRAALYLAEKDYYRRTRRSLIDDLSNPPDNFGELIQYGLGGIGTNTTWQIFQLKNAQEIQQAFESNYERNVGYVQEIEAAAAQVGELNKVIKRFEPEMIVELDQRLQTWYQSASEIQKKKFETALERLGTEQFNEKMKDIPLNSSTLVAASTQAAFGSIPNAAVDPSAVGAKRRIPLTETDTGMAVLNRMNWVAEQTGLATGEKISYEVVSALQPPGSNAAERGGEGTGGYRHGTDVGSADIRLIAEDADGNKRIINANSEGRDKEILNTALTYIGKSGFTGVGIGREYQDGNLHVGFGNPALWNSVNSGDYMRDEYSQYIRAGQAQAQKEGFNFDEYQKERDRAAIQKAAEEIRSSSPVSAATDIAEQNGPAMATGGLMNVPPGENIVGINTTTGETEFVANDRENIRVDPATLENKQQLPTITPEDNQRLEAPVQPMQFRPQMPLPRDNPDPDLYSTLGEGVVPVPPSQLRAANRAKLYGEDSGGLVNGHFS